MITVVEVNPEDTIIITYKGILDNQILDHFQSNWEDIFYPYTHNIITISEGNFKSIEVIKPGK